MRKFLLGATATAVAMASAVASAEENKWYLNAGLGYQFMSEESDLDDAPVIVLSIENKLSDNWGVEGMLTYGTADSSSDNPDRDAEVIFGSLNMLRYYGEQNGLSPYAAVGIGQGALEFDGGLDQESYFTQLNAGGGFRYKLQDNLSLRTDARYFYATDTDANDVILSVGVSFAMGQKSSSSMMPAPAPALGPADGDADGVADTVDQCPGTPAGIAVDAKGCALDKDGDGVPNYRDKCPNTPAGRQVDKFGCKFVLKQTESIKLQVNFPSGSAVIPATQRAEVAKVAEFMKKFSGVRTVIEGHSDSTGAASFNKQLSQKRADAVRLMLINEFGIAANRLSAIGYGEERPIADNNTAAGRLANRRVVAVMEAEVAN